MKTLFSNNETTNNFSFDVLTVEELASVKGGWPKSEDSYVDLT